MIPKRLRAEMDHKKLMSLINTTSLKKGKSNEEKIDDLRREGHIYTKEVVMTEKIRDKFFKLIRILIHNNEKGKEKL